MTACRSCGAKIFFALTTKGKRMPLDNDPVADGNLVIEASPEGLGEMPLVRPYDAGVDGETVRRFVSHFSSCPSASRWREKKREGLHTHRG
jgi:hypothetical protein